MSVTTRVKLVRINCNAIHAQDTLPIEITSNNEDEYDERLGEQVLLLSHDQDTLFGRRSYWIWGVDERRQLITMYYDSDGEDKHLVPNHRANALITAGRFTTRNFNNVIGRTGERLQRNCNQELKDQWGSNFLLGDVICVINDGDGLPDFDIYGHNPIDFVRADRVPSQAMVREYGEEKAHNMIHYNRKYSSMPTTATREELNAYLTDPPYETTTYPLFPQPDVPTDNNYLALLQLWGYSHRDPPAALVQSLDQCQHQVTFALQNGGVLIFWSHRRSEFDWIKLNDQGNYKECLKGLRKGFRNGTITAVFAGDPITIDNRELNTMLVTFEEQQCVAYMLLHRRGDIGDLEHTPYFFTSRNSRDSVIEYITKPE